MRTTLLILLLLLGLAPLARADVSYPAKPGPREFIYDGAKLLTPDDAAAIRQTADKLLAEQNIALVVATIDSMSSLGASGWPIERYAMNLFDEWGLGSPEHNYGILLLVSKGDRKARIELGKAYNRERDEDATRIMSGTIVPRFKRGDFSGGIRAGVQELDAMARQTRASRPASSPAPAAAPRTISAPGSPAPASNAPITTYGGPPTRGFGLGHFLGPLVCLGIGLLGLIILIGGAFKRSLGSGIGAGGSGTGLSRPGLGWAGYGGGYGGGWGSSMPPWWWWIGPGGFGGRGWGSDRDPSWSHHTSSSDSGSSGSSWGGFGGSGGGSFGGSSGSSFGGGFSGGGGATGSW